MRRHCQFTVKRFRVDHVTRFAVRCRSAAGDNPVGSRLERGTPMSVVRESYESELEAQIAADKHTQMNTKAREGQRGAAGGDNQVMCWLVQGCTEESTEKRMSHS